MALSQFVKNYTIITVLYMESPAFCENANQPIRLY